MNDFDVLVIGTGVAGTTVASGCAAQGLRVAVADRLPYGGTCRLRGCDPKKVLLAASDAVSRAESLSGRGVDGRVRVAWPELVRRKRDFTAGVTEHTEAWLSGAGVALLHGEARFVAPDAVEVNDRRISATAIVVASGAAPVHLGFAGQELVVPAHEFMDLDELPPRVVFIGGGYISFEFAALARCAGAEVSILQRGARVLKEFDAELSALLVERYRTLGVTIHLDAPALEVRHERSGMMVRTPAVDVRADLVVHGAGRAADVERLDLDAAGVAWDGRGILVDGHMRSVSNPGVYAAGDAAAAGPPLTPAAGRQANVVVKSILGRDAEYDARGFASVVFSDPPLARVGMSVEEAADDDDLEVAAFDMSDWLTTRRLGHTHAAARIVREKGSGRILGAHLLGPNAEEVVNIFALAVRHGLTASTIADTVWAYPTSGYDVSYMVG